MYLGMCCALCSRVEVTPAKDHFKLKQYEMHTSSLKPGPLFLETKWYVV